MSRSVASGPLALGMAAVLVLLSAANPALAKSSKVKFRTKLVSTGADANASGKIRFREELSKGRTEFNVEVKNLEPASYDVVVGGVVRAVVEVNATARGKTRGEVEFRNPVEPGKVLLDFDPRSQLLTIERAGTVYLQVVVPNVVAKSGGNGGGNGGGGGNDDGPGHT